MTTIQLMLIGRRKRPSLSSPNSVSVVILLASMILRVGRFDDPCAHVCIAGYITRVIVHPAFLNVSFKEAERELSKMEQGEAIFRPSSKVSCSVVWCTSVELSCLIVHMARHSHISE